tara:strand:+ start:101 stop:967 length:867 start_codon:yes stop_codon:yes gene_type:complete
MTRFYKYHGLGNDFIIFNCLEEWPEFLNIPSHSLVKRLCNRRFGIGSDGLILLLPPKGVGQVFMKIINSDGSEAEMCGNGIRCLVRYLIDNNIIKSEIFLIETLAGNIKAKKCNNGEICVDMGKPILEASLIPTLLPVGNNGIPEGYIDIEGTKTKLYSIGMGNPHAIINVKSIDDVPLSKWGSIVENNEYFPKNTNVHFLEVLTVNKLKILVWERGAGATLACGTGACATLVAAYLVGLSDNNANIILPGGNLFIDWPSKNDSVFMTGNAEFVFSGSIDKNNSIYTD